MGCFLWGWGGYVTDEVNPFRINLSYPTDYTLDLLIDEKKRLLKCRIEDIDICENANWNMDTYCAKIVLMKFSHKDIYLIANTCKGKTKY